MSHLRQDRFQVRCEWGLHGVEALAPDSDVVVIVDVLSFTTCVDVAVGRSASVFPYRWRDESAEKYAASLEAILAGPRGSPEGFSLSPASLSALPADARLVLPSPNGSTLSLATGGKPTLAGCLRNARAVANAANSMGERISVVPAGERWPDGSLRPSIEDLVGAGAILHYLGDGRALSPEAEVAVAAFRWTSGSLPRLLSDAVSGRELIEKGFPQDVEMAGMLNCSDTVPVLKDAAYRPWRGR